MHKLLWNGFISFQSIAAKCKNTKFTRVENMQKNQKNKPTNKEKNRQKGRKYICGNQNPCIILFSSHQQLTTTMTTNAHSLFQRVIPLQIANHLEYFKFYFIYFLYQLDTQGPLTKHVSSVILNLFPLSSKQQPVLQQQKKDTDHKKKPKSKWQRRRIFSETDIVVDLFSSKHIRLYERLAHKRTKKE